MLDGKCLVIGASGFLGSHVAKQLVADGNDVRIMVRPSSDTRATDHLDVERFTGSPFNAGELRQALQGVDYVFYCVVDTRSWLRDTRPLWQTNVEGLKKVLPVVAEFPLKKFVFTSSFTTIGVNPSGVASEADDFNWADKAPAYVLTRVEAERLVLESAARGEVPAVACCVSNTYGADDFGPTPHGKMIWDAATGKTGFWFEGGGESVGVADAARALILAAEKGRVGERYAISERYVTMKDLFTMAANAAGNPPPQKKFPQWLMYSIAACLEGISFVLQRDNHLAISSVRFLTFVKALDTSKARRELGWQPRPVEEAVKEAIDFYQGYLRQRNGTTG